MKRDPIAKMYDKLTTKQQAALAFNQLISGNQVETERVIDAVPIRTYRCKDLDFQDQFEGYKMMALLWALEYWQLYAQRMEALVRLNLYIRRRDWIKADLAHEQLEHLGSCLSAIDRALEVICEARCLDAGAIREMAGCKPTRAITPNKEYTESMTEKLREMLNSLNAPS